MVVEFMNENETNTIKRSEIKPMIFEFLDALFKIRNLDNVESVHFVNHEDVFVFTDNEDLDLEENIINKFAQWEMDYKIFPELHILTKDQKYLLPEGAPGF